MNTTLLKYCTAAVLFGCASWSSFASKPHAAVNGKPAAVPDAARTRADITALLHDFLNPENNAKPEWHAKFWADDLVYTSSSGEVRNKQQILEDVRGAARADEQERAAGKTPAAGPVFTAEDILVRPYGNMAALTFRLVGRNPDGKTAQYRNSGLFLWRNGKWQAVTWQATRMPEAK
jgi:hypothetical protein